LLTLPTVEWEYASGTVAMPSFVPSPNLSIFREIIGLMYTSKANEFTPLATEDPVLLETTGR
jgi:hypothetical protein